jgi:hypothetical protein
VKKAVIISIILLLVLIVPNLLMAQGPLDPNDAMVPIDGGLSLLVAAAVGYGSKKMYEKRKQ